MHVADGCRALSLELVLFSTTHESIEGILLALAEFLKNRPTFVFEHLLEQLVPHQHVSRHVYIVSKRGALATCARVPKCPFKAGCQDARLPYEKSRRQLSSRRLGVEDPPGGYILIGGRAAGN